MTEITPTETAAKLADLIGDVLSASVDPTNLDAQLIEAYGANSMDLVDIVEKIERKFSVNVPNDQVMELKTFGDVLRILQPASQEI